MRPKKEKILQVIEGTDQKIGNLKTAIDTFVQENSEAIGADQNLHVGDEFGLNTRIDEIVSAMWSILDLMLPLLPQITKGSTGEPSIWRSELPTPRVAYGPEDESALLIIDALKPYVHQNETPGRRGSALETLLCNLIIITGNHDRKLHVMPPETAVIGFGAKIPEPCSIDFTVGFVPNNNADIQRALIQSGDIILAHPNAVTHVLESILDGLSTIVATDID